MAKQSGYYELPGDGPFQLVLVDQIQAFFVRANEERVDATALCSDRKTRYHFQFSLSAAQQFVDLHDTTAVLPSAPFAQAPTVAIAHYPVARPFRIFVAYLGPVHFESDKYRVDAFSNELGQTVFLSLSYRAYKELLSSFKYVPTAIAALKVNKRKR